MCHVSHKSFLSSFKSLTSWLCSSTEWMTFLRTFLGTYLILEELIHLVLHTFPGFAMCRNTTNEHSLFKNVERAVLCWNQLGEKRRRWMHGNWCGSQISPGCYAFPVSVLCVFYSFLKSFLYVSSLISIWCLPPGPSEKHWIQYQCKCIKTTKIPQKHSFTFQAMLTIYLFSI